MHRGRYITAFWLDAIALCPPTIAFIFFVSYLVNGGWERRSFIEPSYDIGFPWHFYSFHQGITFIRIAAFWADVIVLAVFLLPTYYLVVRSAFLWTRKLRRGGFETSRGTR